MASLQQGWPGRDAPRWTPQPLAAGEVILFFPLLILLFPLETAAMWRPKEQFWCHLVADMNNSNSEVEPRGQAIAAGAKSPFLQLQKNPKAGR